MLHQPFNTLIRSTMAYCQKIVPFQKCYGQCGKGRSELTETLQQYPYEYRAQKLCKIKNKKWIQLANTYMITVMLCYTGMPSNKHIQLRITLFYKLLCFRGQGVSGKSHHPLKSLALNKQQLSYNMVHEQTFFFGASSTFFSV